MNNSVKLNSVSENIFRSGLENASGKIEYTLTNDYMFRIVFQEDPVALKGLVAALLYLDLEDVEDIELTNSIIVGESIADKEFRLDLYLKLKDGRNMNIELQIRNLGDWTNRSLVYLCRMFDEISRGDSYAKMKPALQIGILDYTLFSDNKEFYSCYKMMNTRSGKVYNDNFELRVLELNSVELATEEDKKHKLDEWAKLFKAQTWEELKMIADKDPAMKSAVSSIYRYEADENVRKRCRDREDYLRNEYFMHRDLELTKNELDMTKSELEGTKSNLSKTKSELTEAKTELTETKSELTEAKSELTETKSELTEAKTELTETKSELTEAKSALYDLQEKNAQMADEIASLKAQLRSKNSVE